MDILSENMLDCMPPEAKTMIANGFSRSLEACAPVSIPNPKTDGDSGIIEFSDGSVIDWDWDDGMFECEGFTFEYPFENHDDPFILQRDKLL